MSYKDVIKALEELSKTSVYVGVPADSKDRTRTLNQEAANMLKGGSAGRVPTNAELAYIHETGSPLHNIPARPFLKPGVEESQKQWLKYLDQAAVAAFHGDSGVMQRAFEAAGQIATSAVKKKITDGIPPPIKPATMAARARHRGGLTKTGKRGAKWQKRAAERAAYRKFYSGFKKGDPISAGGVTPLVDTGQLLNSITYVVERK